MRPVVLAIGGSDSSGGAGIQADLASFADFGVKGCTCITALTAQNPLAVRRIKPSPLAQIEAEIRAVFDFYDVAAVKTGMLYDASRVRLVMRLLRRYHQGKPLVVDPVMRASSGIDLLTGAGLAPLRRLLSIATLATPNIPEAEALLGRAIVEPQADVAKLVSQLGCAVLLKGGHGEGERVRDVLCANGEVVVFEHERREWDIEQRHGTGCSLASAIAASLAQGEELIAAVGKAEQWLQQGRVA